MAVAVQKNIPDRIKLILQLVVFTIATCFVLLFLSTLILINVGINDNYSKIILVGVLAFSILSNVTIFVYRWRKLIQHEKSGEIPDMQDMRNITPRQMIFLAIGAPLFVISFVLYQFDYKPAAALCFISFILLGVTEKAYVKKRYKRMQEGKSIE